MLLMSKILWLYTLLLPSTRLLLESLHLLHYPSHFLTSGNDKVVQDYDMSTDKVLMSLKGHPKKINYVALHEMQDEDTLILSASADQITKVWVHDTSSEYIRKSTVCMLKGGLTGLAVQPTNSIFALSC